MAEGNNNHASHGGPLVRRPQARLRPPRQSRGQGVQAARQRRQELRRQGGSGRAVTMTTAGTVATMTHGMVPVTASAGSTATVNVITTASVGSTVTVNAVTTARRRYNDGEGERRYGNGGHRNGQGGGNRSFHHGNGQGNRSGFRRNGQHGGDNPRYRDGGRDGFRDRNRPYHQDRQDRRHDGQARDERRVSSPPRRSASTARPSAASTCPSHAAIPTAR